MKLVKAHCDAGHPDHSADLARLNRISGQIAGVGRMIEERRYCPDIITQLRAVQSAAKAVESNILRRHLEACVHDAFSADNEIATREKIDELISLFKKLD